MHDFLFIIEATFKAVTPLILAAMAGMLSERAGIVQIALEGQILMGAFLAATFSYLFHNPWIGWGVAILGTMLFIGIFAISVLIFEADQTVAGTALNFLALGITSLLCKKIFDSTLATPNLEATDRFPGWVVWLVLAVPFILHWFMTHMRFGLWLRFSGENPEALASAGISPRKVRLFALLGCGALCATAGAVLSTLQATSFSRDMSAGRGFVALAALIFGHWKPLPTLLTCLFFGLTDVLQVRLQGAEHLPFTIPVQFIQVLPYVVTLVVLSGFVRRAESPLALGRKIMVGMGWMILPVLLLSNCQRAPQTAPAKPLPKMSAETAQAFAAEIVTVTFGEALTATQKNQTIQALGAPLTQGASLEGVYRGLAVNRDLLAHPSDFFLLKKRLAFELLRRAELAADFNAYFLRVTREFCQVKREQNFSFGTPFRDRCGPDEMRHYFSLFNGAQDRQKWELVNMLSRTVDYYREKNISADEIEKKMETHL